MSRIAQKRAQVSCDGPAGGVDVRILKRFTVLTRTLDQTNQDQAAYACLCCFTNEENVVFAGEAVEDWLQASPPPRKWDAIVIGEKLGI